MKKLLMLLFFISINAFSQECMLGEVKTFAGNFVPSGWMQASGQLISISQNSALFSLLGTNYGGDGRTTFALPNLNGRSIIGTGNFKNGSTNEIFQVGEQGGVDNVQIFNYNLPTTVTNLKMLKITGYESLVKSVTADSESAVNIPFVQETDVQVLNGNQNLPMATRNPYLSMMQIICVQGIYPSRNY